MPNLRLCGLICSVLFSVAVAEAAVAWRRIDSSPGGILPPPPSDVEPTATLTVDVDGDVALDLIVGGRNASPALTLYRYAAGRWTPEVIEPDDVRVEAGGAAHDIDGDGDFDVVFGGDFKSGEIWWWENPHPKKGRWSKHVLKRDGSVQHHDQIFGDFDGDGKVELVAWNQRAFSLLRLQIPATPKAGALWPMTAIYQRTDKVRQEGLAKADVDGDGVDDLIGGGYWFHHTGGGKFAAEVIDAKMNYTRAGAGQLVKGGRAELVFVPGDLDGPLNWYQWEGGKWVAHTLVDHIIHGHSLQIADLDGDGNLDILVGEMGFWSQRVDDPMARVLVFYGDGRGNFEKQIVSVGQGVHECRVADLNGDGRLDIFAKPFRHNSPRLVVWLNEGRVKTPLPLDRWARHQIDDALPAPAKRLFVDAVDLDGDGHRDIVSGDAWFKNPGRIGGKWEKCVIGAGFKNFAVAHDFNRDGALDLFGTTADFQGNQLVVAFNDGHGKFTLRTDLPAGDGDFLQGVVAGRLQNNVNLIALSWHKNTSGVQALVFPDDGAKGPWQLKVLSPFSRNEQLSLADLDRDSAPDLILGDHWLRNTGEGWTSQQMGVVNDAEKAAEPDRNRVADLNGDGWLDVVVALEKGTKLYWFEHPGSDKTATGPWKRHLLGDVPGQGFSMDVADFDGDGDMDVVVGEHRNPSKVNRVVLFENVDARGGQWRERVLDQGPADQIDHHDGTVAVDVDGDGDLDLVTIGFYNPKIWVLENKAIDRPAR